MSDKKIQVDEYNQHQIYKSLKGIPNEICFAYLRRSST